MMNKLIVGLGFLCTVNSFISTTRTSELSSSKSSNPTAYTDTFIIPSINFLLSLLYYDYNQESYDGEICHVLIYNLGFFNFPNPYDKIPIPVQIENAFLRNQSAIEDKSVPLKQRFKILVPDVEPRLQKNGILCRSVVFPVPMPQHLKALVNLERKFRKLMKEFKPENPLWKDSEVDGWYSEMYDEFEELRYSTFFRTGVGVVLTSDIDGIWENMHTGDNDVMPNGVFGAYHLSHVMIFELEFKQRQFHRDNWDLGFVFRGNSIHYIRYGGSSLTAKPVEIEYRKVDVKYLFGYFHPHIFWQSLNDVKFQFTFYQWRWPTQHWNKRTKDVEISATWLYENQELFEQSRVIMLNSIMANLLCRKHNLTFAKKPQDRPTPAFLFTYEYKHLTGSPMLDKHPPIFHPFWDYAIWETVGLKVITCSPMRTYLAYSAYVKPYEWKFWAVLGPITGIVVGLTWILLWVGKDVTKVSGIDLFLLMGGTMLEASVEVKLSSVQLRQIWVFWAVMCLVICNGYKGIVTNDITAPFASNLPTSLKDLRSGKFKFIHADANISTLDITRSSWEIFYNSPRAHQSSPEISAEVYRSAWMHSLRPFKDNWVTETKKDKNRTFLINGDSYTMEDALTQLFPPDNNWAYHVYLCYFPEEEETLKKTEHWYKGALCTADRKRFLKDTADFYNISYLIVNSTSLYVNLHRKYYKSPDLAKRHADRCNGTAFLVKSGVDEGHFLHNIFGERSALTRFPYRTMDQTFLEKKRFVVFSKHGGILVLGVFQKIFGAGIYQLWRTRVDRYWLPKLNETEGIGVAPQKLSSNIVTIFYILGGGLSLAGICGVLEFYSVPGNLHGLSRKVMVLGKITLTILTLPVWFVMKNFRELIRVVKWGLANCLNHLRKVK